MPLDLALDFAHALDPVGFVQDRLKLEPDPWQARLLRSRAPWILLNCCRQSGKSMTTQGSLWSQAVPACNLLNTFIGSKRKRPQTATSAQYLPPSSGA
jgi:hypothetical protein